MENQLRTRRTSNKSGCGVFQSGKVLPARVQGPVGGQGRHGARTPRESQGNESMDRGKLPSRDPGGSGRWLSKYFTLEWSCRQNAAVTLSHSHVEGNPTDIHLVVAVGGDGTLLKAAAHFGGNAPTPPILGFRAGRLNWLLPFDFDRRYDAVLRTALEGKAAIEERYKPQSGSSSSSSISTRPC